MTTALTVSQQPRGLALATFDDALRFATMVSKSDFAPKEFKGKPESCLLAVQHGSEIGLGPMQSLQSIAVINGRPSIWGDAALAVCMGSLACEYVRESIEGEGDNMVAICEAKRRQFERPVVVRFSVGDAKRAQLWGKAGPWTQYPKRMLQMRARGFALRDAFPDVLRGLVTAEEAQDYPEARPEPRQPLKAEPVATAATPVATADDMARSRHAIQRVRDRGKLEEMQSVVDQRLAAGFYTAEQADELLSLINTKLDWLSEGHDAGQDFPHEAAEHEVSA